MFFSDFAHFKFSFKSHYAAARRHKKTPKISRVFEVEITRILEKTADGYKYGVVVI